MCAQLAQTPFTAFADGLKPFYLTRVKEVIWGILSSSEELTPLTFWLDGVELDDEKALHQISNPLRTSIHVRTSNSSPAQPSKVVTVGSIEAAPPQGTDSEPPIEAIQALRPMSPRRRSHSGSADLSRPKAGQPRPSAVPDKVAPVPNKAGKRVAVLPDPPAIVDPLAIVDRPAIVEPPGIDDGPSRLVVTFMLRGEDELIVELPSDADILQAQSAIAELSAVASSDVRVFYRGRALGGGVRLAKMKLATGVRLNVFVEQASDFLVRSAQWGKAAERIYRFKGNEPPNREMELTLPRDATLETALSKIATELQIHEGDIDVFDGDVKLNRGQRMVELAPIDGFFWFRTGK
jgi:hypothetical protein